MVKQIRQFSPRNSPRQTDETNTGRYHRNILLDLTSSLRSLHLSTFNSFVFFFFNFDFVFLCSRVCFMPSDGVRKNVRCLNGFTHFLRRVGTLHNDAFFRKTTMSMNWWEETMTTTTATSTVLLDPNRRPCDDWRLAIGGKNDSRFRFL